MSLPRFAGLTVQPAGEGVSLPMSVFGERVWVVEPGADRARADEVCEQFAAFVSACPPEDLVIVCDVGAITDPEITMLSFLARLQTIARRRGRTIQLHRARRRMIELILFCGLGAVLPLYRGLSLEPHGQAEEGEEPLDIEEIVDPLNPPG